MFVSAFQHLITGRSSAASGGATTAAAAGACFAGAARLRCRRTNRSRERSRGGGLLRFPGRSAAP